MEKLKVYAAGIANRRNDWVWQGTVVCNSIKEGKKLLTEFKHQVGLEGRCEVATLLGEPIYTTRPKGVSESTFLN